MVEHKRFKVPLKCSTSGATYNDDRWLFVGLGVRWEGFVVFTLPPCEETDQVFPPRARHSFSFSDANCDRGELLRRSKLTKCQPRRAGQMLCLRFLELNQLNEVLHGKCLALQAELSGSSKILGYTRFHQLVFQVFAVWEKSLNLRTNVGV